MNQRIRSVERALDTAASCLVCYFAGLFAPAWWRWLFGGDIGSAASLVAHGALAGVLLACAAGWLVVLVARKRAEHRSRDAGE